MSAAALDMQPRHEPFDLDPLMITDGASRAANTLPDDPYLLDLAIDPAQISTVVDHVSNVEYLRWLDRAAELHADSVGLTRRWLLDAGLMWFVARHEIDYLAEVGLGDRLVVATWVRSVARVKSWRDYLIVRPADGVAVCRAATLWVLVDLQTRKPVRIPPDMVARLAPNLARSEHASVDPGTN